nr:MAG TPA: 3'5'-cyclic nucleotide phosphodiesterase [Caudoviricetes sp.]
MIVVLGLSYEELPHNFLRVLMTRQDWLPSTFTQHSEKRYSN